MKHFLMVALLLATTSLLAQTSKSLVPEKCKLHWTGSKLNSDHTGHVPVKSGNITIDGKRFSAAEVIMDMAGITCIDVTDPESNADLVSHLKSEDFFHVDQHPTATFRTTAIEAIADAAPGKPNYRVTGDLTIKGITQPNSFDLLFWMDGDVARAAATFSFDRAKYDVKYRSGTFFPEIGDRVISDKVDLTFDVTAR
ncbi:MAG: YceI family protein [Flavobacteriales bacterium]|jgi:polyisoprenoid-binding protein YceI|nr:YceI family protein [Flavobacteriales bacterium]